MGDLRELEKGIRSAEKVDLERVSILLGSKYEVLGLIGSGGMGNVYYGRLADDPDSEVAIKVLHPEFVNDSTLNARFLREAELLKKVNHPGVVSLYDAKSEYGIAYYVMEYVTGSTLEDLLKKENFPIDKIPEVVIKICEALHAVHSVGIIHRDLKPANIMITRSYDIKLTDFGIARPENSQLTHHNEIVGSVCYIPPEIWIGESPTPSVDLYSLGIVMYELLTGDVPFDGTSPGELMRKHLQSLPMPPKELNPGIPSYLNRITLSLLSKSRLDRPRDALTVVAKIKSVIGSLSSSSTFVSYKQDTEEFLRVLETSENDISDSSGKQNPVSSENMKSEAIPSVLSEKISTGLSGQAPGVLSERENMGADFEGFNLRRDKVPGENGPENSLLQALSPVEMVGLFALLLLVVITSGSLLFILR